MLIGVDFDNTIVCYDTLFHVVAVNRGLIPPDVPAEKERVRDYLRQHGAEASWTELQGDVYGLGIDQAPPFSGVLEFFATCARRGIEACIISHRTLRPCRGPDVNLHSVARNWLKKHHFHEPGHIGLPTELVYFEETQKRKMDRIIRTGCSHFIDDLPEFLSRPDFPAVVQRIMFDPHGRHPEHSGVCRAKDWSEIMTFIDGGCQP
jgi:hypothetical protein